ncbi:MAG: winged helix-turn-helix domain-containing protein [Methylobacteriaceae bacterium]|nr:winged helix-turn-helix domain-containing protein [Methylobacteriaceae bacterium]
MEEQGDVVSFGPFRLYPEHRKLFCEGAEVRLGGRAMDVLKALAKKNGALVHSEELFAAAWPDVFVHESNLKVTVASLRRTLREYSPAHDYVRNVVGRGYWLSPDVRPLSSSDDLPRSTPLPDLRTVIGRDEEIAALCATMAHHRLSTIVAAGGMGKTTVAVAAAQIFEDETGHAATFVDLARVVNGEFVASTIAAALGISLEGRDVLPAATSLLARRKALLVLDTCEHVQSEVARVCDILLADTSNLRVLATSRQVLDAQHEHVVWLPPLKIPPRDCDHTVEAVLAYSGPQLLAARALEKAGYRIQDGDAPAIAEICRRLDGAPLAIELASSRLKARSADFVLGELNDRFRRLRRDDPGGPLRQQTLLMTLEWSYALLTRSEAEVLRAVSIFSAAFITDSAIYVGAALDLSPPVVVEAISGLLSKAMLSIDREAGEPRYRLLDSTRAFAGDLLVAHGELDRVSSRHARRQLEILERASLEQAGMAARDWQMLCAGLVDDLRKAIDWALHGREDLLLGTRLVAAGLPLWQTLSLDLESCRNCRAALAELDGIDCKDPSLKLNLAVGLATANALLFDDPEKTISMFQRAIDLAREASDANAEFRALGALALYAVLPGNRSNLPDILEAMRLAAVRTNDPFALWEHQHVYGFWEAGEGYLVKYHARLEKVFAEMDDYSEHSLSKSQLNMKAMIRTGFAASAWYAGKPGRAQKLIDETLEMALNLGHGLTLAYCLSTGLIDTLLHMGDYKKAAYGLGLLERTIDQNGLGAWVGRAVCFRAVLNACSSDAHDPAELRLAFDSLYRKAARVAHQGYLSILAETMLENGHVDDAVEALDFIFARGPHREMRPEFLRIKAGTERAKGQIGEAEARLRAALRDADEIEVPCFKFRAAYDLASLLHERGASGEARALLAPLYGQFTDGFDTRDLRRARDLLERLG